MPAALGGSREQIEGKDATDEAGSEKCQMMAWFIV